MNRAPNPFREVKGWGRRFKAGCRKNGRKATLWQDDEEFARLVLPAFVHRLP
jgi:hypothetical protein